MRLAFLAIYLGLISQYPVATQYDLEKRQFVNLGDDFQPQGGFQTKSFGDGFPGLGGLGGLGGIGGLDQGSEEGNDPQLHLSENSLGGLSVGGEDGLSSLIGGNSPFGGGGLGGMSNSAGTASMGGQNSYQDENVPDQSEKNLMSSLTNNNNNNNNNYETSEGAQSSNANSENRDIDSTGNEGGGGGGLSNTAPSDMESKVNLQDTLSTDGSNTPDLNHLLQATGFGSLGGSDTSQQESVGSHSKSSKDEDALIDEGLGNLEKLINGGNGGGGGGSSTGGGAGTASASAAAPAGGGGGGPATASAAPAPQASPKQDFLNQELSQLDVSDAKLQKMLEDGLQNDFTSETHSPTEDAQPSESPDEAPGFDLSSNALTQAFGGLGGNSNGLHMAQVRPGETVHVHASDNPHSESKNGNVGNEAQMTAQQVEKGAEKAHLEKLHKLKSRLHEVKQKLEELEEAQSKKSQSSNSPQGKRNDAVKKLLIKNLKLAALIATKEIEIEQAKSKTFSAKKEQDGALEPEVDSVPIQIHPSKTAKPLTALSRKAEEEVNNLGSTHSLKAGNKTKAAISPTEVSFGGIQQQSNATVQSLNRTDISNNNSRDAHASVNPTTNVRSYDKLQQQIHQMEPPKQALAKLYKALKFRGSATGDRRANPIRYESLGCWKDKDEHAVESLENSFSTATDKDYTVRQHPVFKCARSAKEKKLPGFAMSNGGECFGSVDILKTFNIYGSSEGCNTDGKGGKSSINVYKFVTNLSKAES